MSPKGSQNGAQSGTPWEGEISLGNFSEGPPEDSNAFFSPPGGSGSVLGISRGGSWSPLGAQEGPGGLQEPFRHHLGSQNGAPRPHFSAFLDTLGLYFGHLRPLPSQASRLCCCLVFARGCSFGPPALVRRNARSD